MAIMHITGISKKAIFSYESNFILVYIIVLVLLCPQKARISNATSAKSKGIYFNTEARFC